MAGVPGAVARIRGAMFASHAKRSCARLLSSRPHSVMVTSARCMSNTVLRAGSSLDWAHGRATRAPAACEVGGVRALSSRRMKRKWEQERRLQEEEGSSLAPRNDEENNHMQQQTPFLLQDQGSQSTAGQIVTVRRGRVLAEGVHTTDACFPVLSTWLYSSLPLGQVWDWG